MTQHFISPSEAESTQYLHLMCTHDCGHQHQPAPTQCWPCHARSFVEKPHTVIHALHKENLSVFERALSEAGALKVQLAEAHKIHGNEMRRLIDDSADRDRRNFAEIERLTRAVDTSEPVQAVADLQAEVERLRVELAARDAALAAYRDQHPHVTSSRDRLWEQWGDTPVVATLAQTPDPLPVDQITRLMGVEGDEPTIERIEQAAADGMLSKMNGGYGLPGWVRTRWTNENGA